MSDPNEKSLSSPRPAYNWVLLLVLALVAASLATPLAVRIIDAIPLLEFLQGYSATKVFRRLIIVFFVAGIWIQRRRLLFPSASRIGLTRHRAWRRHLAVGLLVGLMGLLVVQAAAFCVGHRVPDRDFGFALFAQTLIMSLGTAAVVGLLEEILFRGALLHFLLRRTGKPAAVGLTSLIFAAVHFFRSGSIDVDRASLLLGPLAAWDLLHGWWQHLILLPDFVGLLLVSAVLCWSVLLAKDIFVAIGLHAGWVFVIQFTRKMLDRTHGVPEWIFGGSQFYDGLVGLVLLVAMIPLLHFCAKWGWIKSGPD